MSFEQLFGRWRIVSVEGQVGERIHYPYGKYPIGYIIYNEDGYMSVAFMSKERRNLSVEDPISASKEEKAEAFDTFLAYIAKYEVKEDSVLHHIEVCSIPNNVGKTVARFYEFEGNKLILSTPPIPAHGEVQRFFLIWEKIEG